MWRSSVVGGLLVALLAGLAITGCSSKTAANMAGSHTVAYATNGATGGTAPIDSASYQAGSAVTVAANSGALVRTSFTFTGWNTAADGSGTAYSASGAAMFTMGDASVTLYASWAATALYGVTYSGNGATSGVIPVDNAQYQACTSLER